VPTVELARSAVRRADLVYTVVRFVGVIAAIGTAAAILSYAFVAEAVRPWVLYFGFCALALAVGMVCLLAARLFELLVKHAKQLEARLPKAREQGRAETDAAPDHGGNS
jgi:uncharacterized membrane protein YedE/YeeE